MATFKIFNYHFRTQFALLLIVEFIFIYFSVYSGEYFRFGELSLQSKEINIENMPQKALLYSVILLCGLIAMGQYQIPKSKSKNDFSRITIRMLISIFLGLFALAVCYYLFPELLLGRGILAISLGTSLVGLILIRLIFYKVVDNHLLRRKILVLGTGELASNLLSKMVGRSLNKTEPENASYAVSGFVEFGDEPSKVAKEYIVNPGKNLAQYCEDFEIDEIVLAISDSRKKMPVDALLDCKLSHINVIDYVSFWEREQGILRIDNMNPSWMIFCDGCHDGIVNHFFERIFDVVISLVIFIFMLPVLLVTAALIFIENGFKGPVFYTQQRVGLNGLSFKLYKFRSMIVNAEKSGMAQWAQQNDSRITRVGKFIRRTRIDELPQILNILKGEMGIVGPRPERPEFVIELDKKIPFFNARHFVKPGLTGWAQLNYPYGASEKDTYNKLQYDLFYVKNHSFLMNVVVLLQTIEVILLGKGAR